MTSNIGAELIKRQGVMGFGAVAEDTNFEAMKGKILEEAKRVLKPEFINRLDDLIVFHTLGKPELLKIVDLEIAKVLERVKAKDIKLVLDDKAKDFLIENGYDPAYGARPMRRAVERHLEDPMAEEILRGHIKPGDTAHVSAEGGKLTFHVPESAVGEQPAGAN
jgi:ATP-dependent Clp protease ATP-binding subunit ClpC